MPAPANRISVTTASLRQQKLLEYQAGLTGRSVSSLASFLLEEIVDQKVRQGRWEPTAIRMVEELIKAKTWSAGPDHDVTLLKLEDEAWNADMASDAEIDGTFDHDSPRVLGYSREGGPQPGYFDERFAERQAQDAEAAKNAAVEKEAKRFEEEMVAYGMRYGLVKEEAEDLFERFEGQGRACVRYEMRKAARHLERLVEGQTLADVNTSKLEFDDDEVL